MRYGKYLETSIGRLYAEEENGVLVRLGAAGASAPDPGELRDTPLLLQVQAQIQEYLEGRRLEFTLPIRMEGTDFQKRIWEALKRIPYGETRTYGQIAAEAGSPKGARAVGMACNKNPILLVIPCHRVIGSDGRLVGFGCGLPMKEALLALEKDTTGDQTEK